MRHLALTLPWLVNLALIAWLSLDIPWWDDWEGVDWWLRTREGGLDLGSLWAAHNEHRIVLARLLFYLALESGVGLVPLMLLSHAMLGAALWLLAPLLRSAGAGLPSRQRIWILVGFSAFLLAWVQWQNVLMAFQVCWNGTLLGAVLAVRGMADPAGRAAGWKVGAGIALAYLSSGLWLVLAPLLVAWQGMRLFDAAGSAPRRRSMQQFAGLAAILGVLVALYLGGLRSSQPGPLLPAVEPVATAIFLLRLYGSPFTVTAAQPWTGIGTAMGVLFAVGSAVLAVAAWRRRGGATPLPAFGIAILALAHGAALLIALGRGGHGGDAALASRYAPFILLGWTALLATTLGGSGRHDRVRDAAPSDASRRLAAVFVLAMLAGGSLVGTAKLYRVATARQPRLAAASACLRDVLDDPSLLPSRRPCLAELYPDADRLVDIARRQAQATGGSR